VVERLQETATRSQAEALRVVEAQGGTATSFWVRNTMVVEGDADLVDALAGLPGVADIRPERIYPLIEPVKVEIQEAAPGWGVAKIGADTVWADGVIGGGVRRANLNAAFRRFAALLH
jgi:hypothetical protein